MEPGTLRIRVMLLCLSRLSLGVFQLSVEAARDVAFEGADRFAFGLAFSRASVDVVDRALVASPAGEHDRVQGAVELAVAAAVEAVADRLAGAAGDRSHAGEPGESRFGAEPAGM